jgi:hypothetical protein
LISAERASGWQLDVDAAGIGSWSLEASLATLARPFAPCAVEWAGRTLDPAAWHYDAGTQVLRVRFSGPAGRLVVRAACDDAG